MNTTRRYLFKLATAAAASMLAGPALAAGRCTPGARPRPLRILILGGTGFTGPHQVRYALARGHSVTLFNRGRQKVDWPGPVEELIGDREAGDVGALKDRSWDVCIDNPTTLPRWVRDVGVALKGRVGQYVFISTVGTYADFARPDMDESAPQSRYAGADALAETMESFKNSKGELYGPLKAYSEAEAARQFPGITTVIRPGLIVGPGDETDRFTYWPVRMARGGEVLAPGAGTDPVQVIDARDLAEWTIRLVESRTFGTFNATGPARPVPFADMVRTVGEAVKSDGRVTWVPESFLTEQKVEAFGDVPVWMPVSGPLGGLMRVNIAKALASGLTYRPLATTAADTLAWWRTLPAERQTLRSGMAPAREAEVLAAWHASSPNA